MDGKNSIFRPFMIFFYLFNHVLKDARSKEVKQEEELRLDTLVAETSTHLHQHIEKLAQLGQK